MFTKKWNIRLKSTDNHFLLFVCLTFSSFRWLGDLSWEERPVRAPSLHTGRRFRSQTKCWKFRIGQKVRLYGAKIVTGRRFRSQIKCWKIQNWLKIRKYWYAKIVPKTMWSNNLQKEIANSENVNDIRSLGWTDLIRGSGVKVEENSYKVAFVTEV